MKFVKWDLERIEAMIKRAHGKYNFTFRGIQLWFGIYIGFIDGRIK
jgi:hypothetical protein